MEKTEKFPFNLKTQEQKDKWLYPRKAIFLVSLIFFILGMIFIFIPTLNLAGAMLLGIGGIPLWAFLIYFWIINLIVMWRADRHVYFWFSVFIRIVWVVFFFSEFYPFLKGKATIKELMGKEKMSKEEKAKIEYYQKNKSEIDKKENKEFIQFIK